MVLDCVESDMGKANGVWSVAKHSASPAIRQSSANYQTRPIWVFGSHGGAKAKRIDP